MRKPVLSDLQQIRNHPARPDALSVVALLLKDHRAMRDLVKIVRSKRLSRARVIEGFNTLEKVVLSHVTSEEHALLNHIKSNPRFEDEALESIEEHEIHRNILQGIRRTKDSKRRIIRMKIFCEMLEQHLDEEEKDLFPKFRKYAALSTKKKLGREFLKSRKRTHRRGEKLGVLKP